MKSDIEFAILNIDKPSGPTSFQVAEIVGKIVGARKFSHFGTLDPKVTGVLPIALNRACKLTGFFMKKSKYESSIENASIMRQFSVLFLLSSLIPMSILFFFYIEIKNYGEIRSGLTSLNVALIFVALGVMLGYFYLRRVLSRVVDLMTDQVVVVLAFVEEVFQIFKGLVRMISAFISNSSKPIATPRVDFSRV